jgi:hypothetical protein
MALTRANIEVLLISRTGQLLTVIGLDGTTVDGTNTDLNDPIGYGIRNSGGTVADFTNVVDSDVTTVAESDYDQLIDIAELRTLMNIQGNYDLVDTDVGEVTEDWSKLGDTLEKAIDRKQKQVDDIYDFGAKELDGGVISFDFAEHDVDNVDELGR